MQPQVLPKNWAVEIYKILMEECGALESMQEYFVATQSSEFCREFRFQGHLGFGGKFWRNGEQWYVTGYDEDETADTRKKIVAADLRLKDLLKLYRDYDALKDIAALY